MSVDILKLIPVDPHYVPTKAAQLTAIAALEAALPEGHDCEAQDFGHITFIDQGENLEAIICPLCSRRLPFYDTADADAIQAWWHEAIDEVEEADAEGISLKMPCCSRSTPLIALQFDWPAGFARFELCIWDPGIGENLPAPKLKEFEEILGCALRQVRAHY